MPRTIIDDGTPTGRLTFICTVGCGGAALREMTLSFVSGTSISAIPARMRAFLPLTSMTVALLLVPMSCTVSPALSSCPVATTDSAVSFFSSRLYRGLFDFLEVAALFLKLAAGLRLCLGVLHVLDERARRVLGVAHYRERLFVGLRYERVALLLDGLYLRLVVLFERGELLARALYLARFAFERRALFVQLADEVLHRDLAAVYRLFGAADYLLLHAEACQR